MPASAADHPFLSRLLGDEGLSALFSADADIEGMLRFWRALGRAEAEAGLISTDAAQAIASASDGFRPDFEELAIGAARDGVVVPALFDQLRARMPEAHRSKLHFGATSQDAIDTSLALRLKRASGELHGRATRLVAALDRMEAEVGAVTVMGHTRMQAAIAVPASRKIAAWRNMLVRCNARLDAATQDVALVSLGGAAGTQEKLAGKGPAIAARVAELLDLACPEHARHNERDGIVAYASALAGLTGALGKLGQDIALGAQTEVGEIKLAGGGGSSAMPHKVNPVGAETLVALARFNATLAGGMQHAMIHENERSGAAWTLEWMLLPQMAVAAGAALRTAAALLDGTSFRPTSVNS